MNYNTMMYPFFYIFGHKFMPYDAITLMALAVTSVYFYHSLTAIAIKKNQIWTYVAVRFFVSILGGSIIPFFYKWIYLHETPWLYVWHRSPGRYFHSTFLSLLAYTLLACKFWSWPTRKILDRFFIAIVLGSAIGRIGCFLQGCCQGKPCDFPWAIHLPPHPEIARHPAQAYMFVLEVILVAFLWYFFKNKKRYDGQIFWMGLLLYSVYRFLIEFLRVNPIAALGLTHAQLFSAFAVVLSSVMLLRQRDKLSDGRKV